MDGRPISSPELGPANWSRRYKENLERLRSGDRGQIQTVVGQLSERERTHGISAGESRMLARARQMLDDADGGSAGVREPRRPRPPSDTFTGLLQRETLSDQEAVRGSMIIRWGMPN